MPVDAVMVMSDVIVSRSTGDLDKFSSRVCTVVIDSWYSGGEVEDDDGEELERRRFFRRCWASGFPCRYRRPSYISKRWSC